MILILEPAQVVCLFLMDPQWMCSYPLYPVWKRDVQIAAKTNNYTDDI